MDCVKFNTHRSWTRHYDWGLRAVKSVLVVAGHLKRAEPGLPEEQLLMRALRDFNIPKIVQQDEVVFFGTYPALVWHLCNKQFLYRPIKRLVPWSRSTPSGGHKPCSMHHEGYRRLWSVARPTIYIESCAARWATSYSSLCFCHGTSRCWQINMLEDTIACTWKQGTSEKGPRCTPESEGIAYRRFIWAHRIAVTGVERRVT